MQVLVGEPVMQSELFEPDLGKAAFHEHADFTQEPKA